MGGAGGNPGPYPAANAGGPRLLPFRARWAARIAQFGVKCHGMRKRIVILAGGFALMLVFMWWLGNSASSSEPANEPIQASTDLRIGLVGFTNDPAAVPPNLAVSGSGSGLHALFWVTNTSTNRFIRFKTLGIERRNGSNWNEFVAMAGWPWNQWRGMVGETWSPGFGCIYAVAWPFGLPTNNSWRLRLSVSRERSLPLIIANQRLYRAT